MDDDKDEKIMEKKDGSDDDMDFGE
jgi:G3E family GTPase